MTVDPEVGRDAPVETTEGLDERTAVKSLAWTVVSFAGSKTVVLVVTLVLAALLAPRDFGVVAAGVAVLAYLEIGLDVGLGAALIYEQEKGISRRVQTAFTLNVLVAGAFTVGGVLAAPWLAGLLNVEEHAHLLSLLFLSVLIRGLGQVQDAVLRRDLRFKERTIVDVSRAVVRGVVAISWAVVAPGPEALVAGILASEVVATGLNTWLVRIRPRFIIDRAAARALLGFGSAVVALKVIGVVIATSDHLAVSARLGPEDLGIYSIAHKIPELSIATAFFVFSTVAFSVYSRTRATASDAFGDVMLRALALLSLFGFTAGVGLALVSGDVVSVLFSDRWAPAAGPMALLALTAAVSSVGYASGDIFLASGRQGLLLKITLPVAVASVIGFVALAPLGLMPVAGWGLLMMSVNCGVRLWLAGRVLSVPLASSLSALRPGLLGASAVAVCVLPVQLSMSDGVLSLVLSVLLGALGGWLVLTRFARSTVTELGRLMRHAVAR